MWLAELLAHALIRASFVPDPRPRRCATCCANSLREAQAADQEIRRLKSLEDATKNLLEIDAQLSQIPIKPRTIEDLDELDRQIAALDAQLSAAAATLAVEMTPAGTGEVHVGSLGVEGIHAAPVLGP